MKSLFHLEMVVSAFLAILLVARLPFHAMIKVFSLGIQQECVCQVAYGVGPTQCVMVSAEEIGLYCILHIQHQNYLWCMCHQRWK